jgi:RHS repeat-associated protein
MTHIKPSEDNIGMYDIHPLAERHEQRHLALRTVENCFSRLELQEKYSQITSENGSLDFPFGFAGWLYDKDTKLTRFGVRDYDSETGRWTSKEPLGFDGSRNFYVYAGNDGVNYVDLDGLKRRITNFELINFPISYKLTRMDYLAIEKLKEFYCKGFKNDEEFFANLDINGNIININWSIKGEYNVLEPGYRSDAQVLIHGHGRTGDSESAFSEKDYKISNEDLINIYLVNQKGRIYKYIPNAFRDSQTINQSSLTERDFGTLLRLPDLNCKCNL